MGHYIQNTGNTTLWYLAIFRTDHYADVSLDQWMALTPHELVQQNLNIGPEVMHALRKEKIQVVKSHEFSYYPRSGR